MMTTMGPLVKELIIIMLVSYCEIDCHDTFYHNYIDKIYAYSMTPFVISFGNTFGDPSVPILALG